MSGPPGSPALDHVGRHVNVDTDRAHALFVRHRLFVNRLVFRLLGPDAEHDDIVQDVFVRVTSRAGSLRDPEREAAWVARVAVSVVRNHLRRRRVRRIVELWARVPEQPIEVEPHLLDRDLARRGYCLLDRLDPQERITLLLRRVEERSIDEVAEMCRCSRATVKRRLARAERRLAVLFGDHRELVEQIRHARTSQPGEKR